MQKGVPSVWRERNRTSMVRILVIGSWIPDAINLAAKIATMYGTVTTAYYIHWIYIYIYIYMSRCIYKRN